MSPNIEKTGRGNCHTLPPYILYYLPILPAQRVIVKNKIKNLRNTHLALPADTSYAPTGHCELFIHIIACLWDYFRIVREDRDEAKDRCHGAPGAAA